MYVFRWCSLLLHPAKKGSNPLGKNCKPGFNLNKPFQTHPIKFRFEPKITPYEHKINIPAGRRLCLRPTIFGA